ncbi:ABC transporter permease, partial [Candidatus Woesearchaeota archaeon]|nr:ABC transporter permease [Candidatus Woesearchaeota archaeon]
MKPGIWSFSLRLLWRERRVSDVLILFWALVIAVTQTTTVNLFTDRLQRMLNLQTAEFLAADLAVATTRAIPASWLQRATDTGLSVSQTHEFSSVLMAGDALLLTRIKAVSDR